MSHKSYSHDLLDDFWGCLENGELNKSLETVAKFGMDSDVIEFVFNPSSYYVPNRKGDVFYKPPTTSDDAIPVVCIEDERKYRFVKPTIHALQRIALQNAMFDVERLEEEFALRTEYISSSDGEPGTASVYRHLAYVSEKDATVESKPLVILNSGATDKDKSERCVGVVLHEIVHVAQSLDTPWYTNDPVLERELQAYAVQNGLIFSENISYSMNTAMASMVDSFRRRKMGPDAFKPTEEFEREIMNDDYLKKIIWKPKQSNED
jgi:hypothetical protein